MYRVIKFIRLPFQLYFAITGLFITLQVAAAKSLDPTDPKLAFIFCGIFAIIGIYLLPRKVGVYPLRTSVGVYLFISYVIILLLEAYGQI